MEKTLLNIIKSYYSQFLYFSDKNSFIREEINNLLLIKEKSEIINFIDKSSIFQEQEKNFLKLSLKKMKNNLFYKIFNL